MSLAINPPDMDRIWFLSDFFVIEILLQDLVLKYIETLLAYIPLHPKKHTTSKINEIVTMQRM